MKQVLTNNPQVLSATVKFVFLTLTVSQVSVTKTSHLLSIIYVLTRNLIILVAHLGISVRVCSAAIMESAFRTLEMGAIMKWQGIGVMDRSAIITTIALVNSATNFSNAVPL